MAPRKQHGFTLVEIAIVLVIIGLLLGGILKGQELITSARVRNLITQIDGVKSAYYGFQDRYRALPGDFAQATTQVPGDSASQNGNGNGEIEGPTSPTQNATVNESILVWDHLSHAGFINGTYTYAGATTINSSTTPMNPWNAPMQLIYDSNYYSQATGTAALSTNSRHNFKTGNQIPVDILAEVDRKIDDGNPLTGSLRFSPYADTAGGATAPTAATCINTTVTPAVWAAGSGQANCGAAVLY